jgi:hypothetical protein
MITSDYSVEFAHVAFDEDYNFDEKIVIKSAKLAKRRLDALEKNGCSYTVCILIDDKHVKHGLTYKNVGKFLRFTREHIPRIDYICFEKRLEDYIDAVIDAVDSSYQDRVTGQIYRYRQKHRKLGCSHDIAVWHLMRLGIVNNIDNQTLVYVGSDLSQDGLQRRNPEFVSRNLISILSRSDRPQEERADKEILQYCSQLNVNSQIKRIYFNLNEGQR